MSNRRGNWRLFLSEQEARLAAKQPFHFRVQDVNWSIAGWYWVETYDQPCPRGCCRDSVMRIISAAERAKEIAENMQEMAAALAESRRKSKEDVGVA